MKRMITIGCFLLVFACVIGTFAPNAQAADVSQSKKIVSVVYDDSGSMQSNNRFVYANYAMQTFCGLLGANDELYMIYMNVSQTPERVDLQDGSVQASVDTIRGSGAPDGARTPFESVVRAMNVLRGKNDTDESTEYILLVITDGAFSGMDAAAVRKEIADFADERMANGTKAKVIYLGISSAIQLNLQANNVKEFYAKDGQTGNNSIISKMSEIANFVSGRSQVSGANVQAVNATTLEMHSSVPVANIAALVQGSAGKIVSVTHKETGKKLNVGRNVSSYCAGFSSLSSQSFLITAGKENIPAGTYILNFDQPVAAENVVLMSEPALELRLSISCNGREIDKLTELDGLREKDLISVSYRIYEYGTDNEVLLSALPQGTQAELCVLEDGVEKQKVSGAQNTIHRYELSRSKTVFKATLRLPGFNPIEAYIDFTPLKYVHYTVEAAYGNGAQSVKKNELGGAHGLSLVFTLLADGVPVTDPSVVNGFAPKVNTSPDGNGGTTTVRADGKIVFVPNAAPDQGFVNGSMTVTATCSINGAEGAISYTVIEPVYEVKAEYGSSTESIKLTDITKPHDLSIIFTFWEDGVQITDKAWIEALGYGVTVSNANENGGETLLTEDGKIIFKPNRAEEKGSVTVTCTVGTAKQTKTYEVLDPLYEVKAEYGSNTESIKLTDITKPHDLSIIFTFWEDGVQITDKAWIEALGYGVTVSNANENGGETLLTDDGKIVFTPKTAKQSGTVTVTCTVGTAKQTKTYEVLAPVYEVKAEYGSDVREIHLDHIEKAHGLSIIFTVWEDGAQITDKAKIEALCPKVVCSEEGSEGDRVITEDGKIVFTPNRAYGRTGGGYYDVIVTCTVGESSGSSVYRINLPNIEIHAVEPETAIPKHEFYGNTVSVAFYIVKDGKRLTKEEIEVLEPVILNEKYADLTLNYEIAEDGTVICTPVDTVDHKVTVPRWFFNWRWYWGLPNQDVTVLFSSDYGTAEGVIPVCRAPFWQYQFPMAIVPFVLELAALGFMIYWIACMIFKPKFKGRLYIGQISLAGPDSKNAYCHTLAAAKRYRLKKYNTWKYILKPTWKALEKKFGGVKFKASHAGPQCGKICYSTYLTSGSTGQRVDADMLFGNNAVTVFREVSTSGVIEMKDAVFASPDKNKCYIVPQAKYVDGKGLTHLETAIVIFYV